MGADEQTHPATHTFFLIEFQGDHIFQIDQLIHDSNSLYRDLENHFALSYVIKRDPSQRMKPMIPAPICNGIAHRISFFTPEREVYVEAPVKFIARKAESAGMSRSQASISKRPANVIP